MYWVQLNGSAVIHPYCGTVTYRSNCNIYRLYSSTFQSVSILGWRAVITCLNKKGCFARKEATTNMLGWLKSFKMNSTRACANVFIHKNIIPYHFSLSTSLQSISRSWCPSYRLLSCVLLLVEMGWSPPLSLSLLARYVSYWMLWVTSFRSWRWDL